MLSGRGDWFARVWTWAMRSVRQTECLFLVCLLQRNWVGMGRNWVNFFFALVGYRSVEPPLISLLSTGHLLYTKLAHILNHWAFLGDSGIGRLSSGNHVSQCLLNGFAAGEVVGQKKKKIKRRCFHFTSAHSWVSWLAVGVWLTRVQFRIAQTSIAKMARFFELFFCLQVAFLWVTLKIPHTAVLWEQ